MYDPARVATHEAQAEPQKGDLSLLLLLASLLFPGSGHALAGRRSGRFFAVLWVASSTLCACLALGWTPPDGTPAPAAFFESLWVALSCWLVCQVDLLASPASGGAASPNPRLALLCNLCSRGLGYFYIDRPLLAAASLVGLALWSFYTRDTSSGFCHPLTPLLHLLLGLHAWSVAQAQTRTLALQESPLEDPYGHLRAAPYGAPRRPDSASSNYARTWRFTGGVLGGSALGVCLLALGSLALKSTLDRTCARLALSQEVVRMRPNTPINFAGLGLQMSLPNPHWRIDSPQDACVISLRDGETHLVVFRTTAPDGLGLDGYVVELAGQLATRHGEVRLEHQVTYQAESKKVREISFLWREGDTTSMSHCFLFAQGDAVYSFVVGAPQVLREETRRDILQMIRTGRFVD